MEYLKINYTNNLWKLRQRKGLSLRELSALTGINKSTLNNLERSRRDIRVSTLVILANFFKCGLDDIISRKE